jgi:hypothetical protein
MTQFKIDFLEDYSDEAILLELRRLATSFGTSSVTKAQLESAGRVSYSLIIKRFGSLRRALQLAKLEPRRFMNATDDELLEVLVGLWERVLQKDGRTPQRRDVAAYGLPVSGDTIVRRFGTWKKALMRAHESVNEASVKAQEPEPVPTAQPRQRATLSLRKRFFVMKRDSFSCARCSASGVGVRLEIHHILPFAKGGSDELSNLQTLCFDCNRGQRDDAA